MVHLAVVVFEIMIGNACAGILLVGFVTTVIVCGYCAGMSCICDTSWVHVTMYGHDPNCDSAGSHEERCEFDLVDLT